MYQLFLQEYLMLKNREFRLNCYFKKMRNKFVVEGNGEGDEGTRIKSR